MVEYQDCHMQTFIITLEDNKDIKEKLSKTIYNFFIERSFNFTAFCFYKHHGISFLSMYVFMA